MHHHNHHFWWRFFPHNELSRIYFSTAIRFFAISLISLFVPLYLYKEIGLSFQNTLYFYIFYSVIFAIMSPVAAKFASKYGIKHSVLISIPFYLIFILLLNFLSSYQIPLMLLAFFLGSSLAFYWIGMHLIFHNASHKNHRGEEFGKRAAVSILATLFGPILGGVLIKFMGFKFLFLLVAILLFISAIFLFMSKESHPNYHFSVRSLADRKHWQDSLFFVSRGTRVMANGVIWPLFIFVILNDYLSLGLVGSLLAGISAFLIWFMGKHSDHLNKHKIVHLITGAESFSWFLRSAVTNVSQIFMVTIFGAITHGLMEGPVGALEYDKAKKNAVEYFVSREVFICLGRILITIFVLMSDSLSSGLVLHGVANLAALFF